MAGKDINIGIAGDASKFVRATDDVSEALEDVADSLDDMTRDTKRGADQAERAVDDLADTFRDAQKRAKDLGDAGKDAGDDVERGMKRAEDGVEEFRDEANSTAKEAAASFDGSAESVIDAFQEVAANAFAGFGPAGVLAGLAAALGIGAAVSGFDQVNQAEQESRERAAEWAQAFVEAGDKVLTAAVTSAKALSIATDDEEFKKAGENAKNWGVDVSVAIAAMAGEKWALDAVNQSLIDSEAEVADTYDKAQGQYGGFASSLDKSNIQAERGRDAFNKLTEELKLGGEQFDAYSGYLIAMAEHTEGATRATDEFGDTVVTLPDGKQVYIDAETGQATDNVEAIEKKIYGVPDGDASINLATAEALRLAQNASNQIAGIPDRNAKVNLDTSGAEGALSNFINKRRVVNIEARMAGSVFGKGVY